MTDRPMFRPCAAWLAPSLAVLLALGGCNRAEAPTPGVVGGSANAPGTPGVEKREMPQQSDAQVGAGKSPGGPASAERQPPEGTTGTGGAGPTSTGAPNTAQGMPGSPSQGVSPGAPTPAAPASAPGGG